MKTLLVADDDPNLRLLVSLSLDSPDYEVLEATTGLEVLETLERQSVDLIVLDWMMPAMSGLDVLRTLREQSAPVEIPVIMLTSRSHEADVAAIQDAGVFEYLSKPFSPNELLETVERALLVTQ